MNKKLSLLFLLIGFLFLRVHGQSVNHWETAIFKDDIWKYFVGTSEPPSNWRALAFDDSGWPQGKGGFGFSDNDDNTIIPQCTSVYLRIKFSVTDTAFLIKALLSIDYDDAFVAYINDAEVARAGITGAHPSFNQTGSDHEATVYRGLQPESFILYKNQLRNCLLPGDNILAVQVHNTSSSSSDLSSNIYMSFGVSNASNFYRQVPSWFVALFDFSSSDLPLVVINTNAGESIKNEPKITADMKIIHNGQGKRNYVSDQGNIYSGKVGIEIRGRYSASLPQKPYGFETRDAAGNNLNVSLLGMPAENDWVLLANYNDKSFLRNVLAFEIFKKMGHYAPRMRFCEVILNEEYKGIYLLGEKIKQDSSRVDIAKLKPDDNTGDDLTGGYIIKTDYYTATDSWLSNFSPLNKPGSKVYFVYHDPQAEELNQVQKTYIQGYINTLETILYCQDFRAPVLGYKSYIDINSFADYFILGEVSRNVDAYKKSRFFFKNKDSEDGLLHSGPPWDFDWAFRNLKENCIHMNQTNGSGWAYKINECAASPVPPSWEVRMMQDKEFANRVYTRYSNLRKTILSREELDKTIDSVALLLEEAQVRHFAKWNILGINAGTPEYGIQPLTYAGEIEKFKDWLEIRLSWLDVNMAGFATSIIDYESLIRCRVFPNPATDLLFIESDNEINVVTIVTTSGSVVKEITEIRDQSIHLNISDLEAGLYLVKIQFSSGLNEIVKVIKN